MFRTRLPWSLIRRRGCRGWRRLTACHRGFRAAGRGQNSELGRNGVFSAQSEYLPGCVSGGGSYLGGTGADLPDDAQGAPQAGEPVRGADSGGNAGNAGGQCDNREP